MKQQGESEVKFTKEPLEVRVSSTGDVHVDSADGCLGFAIFHGQDDVAKANAQLFVSAPAMYEALKDLLAISHKIPTCSDVECVVCPNEASVISRARNAIASAERRKA